MLVENLMLGLFGAALGMLIAWWGTEALRAMPPYGAFPGALPDQPRWPRAAVRRRRLAIGCGLMFGAAPALQLGRVDPQQALRSGSKGAGRSAIRDGLMALQCGLALLVLVVAGLFFQSFAETRDTDPGFRIEGLMLATYDLGPLAPTDEYARQFATNCSIGCSACRPSNRPRSPTRCRSTFTACRCAALRLEGRAADHAATGTGVEQHRLARLFQDDGHSDRRR